LVWAVASLGFGACSGSDAPPGPQPLVADPAVLAGCLAAPVAVGQTRAKVVACTDEVPAGRLAVGRVGDLVLENARLEVVIRGFGEGHTLVGSSAGGIVDAARVGGEDLIKEIQPLAELNAGAFDEIVITEAGDDGPATIVVRGRATVVPFVRVAVDPAPLAATLEQHYVLAADADEVLLRTFVWGDPGQSGAVQLADVLMLGGRVEGFLPGRGGVDEGATNGVFLASSGTTSSYGLVYPPDATTAVQFVDVGGLAFLLGQVTALDRGAPLERWLVVGDGSVAAVTERAWTLRGETLGTLTGAAAAGVDIRVDDAAGNPTTIARADASGVYRVAVPPGDCTLVAQSLDHEPSATVAASVVAGVTATVDVPVGASGTVVVTAADADGAPLPARVVLSNATTHRIAYTSAAGRLETRVPAGSYAVTVSRGVEYDAFTVDPLLVADGATTEAHAVLTRVVDTRGWISMDTHLHSEMSSDSTFPLDLRLASVAAEGVEIAVSTDHDFVTDYQPIIDELGLDAWLTTRIGNEASSLVWGHINAWPHEHDVDRAAGGAVAWYDRSPGEVFDLLRGGDASRVVQVNHPRLATSGLFALIDFDPATLQARAAPEELGLPADTDLNDFRFDALEIANGFQGEQFEDDFVDWLALVGAGHPAVATGSSDSHGASAYAGNSRTYVYVGEGEDDPSIVDLAAVDAALKARRVVVSQGAFVVAGLVTPGAGATSLPGELVDLAGATAASVAIRVQAPPWMPLARIRVYAGKTEATSITLDPADTSTVRYDGVIELPLPGTDTFFIVRVDPAGRGDPVLGQPDASFTNPLLVDGDGDGLFAP
jgi:hypothetical protein